MSLLSPRKLYVTQEEFQSLSAIGQDQAIGRIDDSQFAQLVHDLLGINYDTLTSHRWEVVVVEKVTRRCGRNWATRGTIKDRMARNNRERVSDAKRRALESLKNVKLDIDWGRVRQAQERGKRGTMQPGDQELCAEAFKADPERYRKQGDEVRQEVTEEMQMFGRRKP